MLKKIIRISFLASILLFIGCARQPYQQPAANSKFGSPPASAVYEKEIKSHFEATLKDPYSAHYKFMKPYKAYSNSWVSGKQTYWQGWAVQVSVNAKNSYGGYTGAQEYVFAFTGNKIFSFFEEKDFYLVKLVK